MLHSRFLTLLNGKVFTTKECVFVLSHSMMINGAMMVFALLIDKADLIIQSKGDKAISCFMRCSLHMISKRQMTQYTFLTACHIRIATCNHI